MSEAVFYFDPLFSNIYTTLKDAYTKHKHLHSSAQPSQPSPFFPQSKKPKKGPTPGKNFPYKKPFFPKYMISLDSLHSFKSLRSLQPLPINKIYLTATKDSSLIRQAVELCYQPGVFP